MTFGKKTLFSLLLGFDLLTNVLELAQVNFLSTTTLISFCTYVILPGFLISLILRIRKISFWENLLIIIGLSIAFLEFGGLLLNILLPLIGIKDPLAFQNIVFGFDVYVLLLFIFAWIRTKNFVIQISRQSHLIVKSGPTTHSQPRQFVTSSFRNTSSKALEDGGMIISTPILLPKLSNIEKALYILPVFFPILATLGAIVLNNGGNNILTLILQGAIACYSLLLVLFRDKIRGNLYPYAIFFIAMACLFTSSLRSWYIAGADVQAEFYVFHLTNTHHLWNMAFYQDPYNACLSITILPTLLTNLLNIPDLYVYKVIFQIFSTFLPILLFFIIRNYSTPVLSFLSALFFISCPEFLNDIYMGNREEIGFIFFGLALYMILLPKLPLAMRRILFIIFALSIIISHYSTNFIFLMLITFVYVFTLIISRPWVRNVCSWLLAKSHIRLKNTFSDNVFLSLPLIVLLFFMTVFWNTLYTSSSNHLGSVIEETAKSMFMPSGSDTKSSDISYSIFFSSAKQDPKKLLQDYISHLRQSETARNSNFYSPSITSRYPSYPIPQEQLAPTRLGNWLSSFYIPVFNIQADLRLFFAYFMQILVLIGLFSIFIFKSKRRFDTQYILFCVGSLCILALMTVLPAISVEYGIQRMFQQCLFVLSLPIVIGLSSLLFFVKEQKRIIFVSIMAVLFFLDLTGFIPHLTGDYYPQMILDNAGLYYDAYYVDKSDVLAIVWLSKNNVGHTLVEALDSTRLQAYGGIFALKQILPEVIQKNAYVYLKVSSDRVVIMWQHTLICNSPKHFLDDNKNLLYSNGKVNIYK